MPRVPKKVFQSKKSMANLFIHPTKEKKSSGWEIGHKLPKKPVDNVQRAKDLKKAEENFLRTHNHDLLQLRTIKDILGEEEFIKRWLNK